MAMNYRQIKAIEKKNKDRILALNPTVPDTSGIYFFIRQEDEIKYAYVGQAKHLLTRLAQHLSGYQYIDLSIKKHGLWDFENPFGWKIEFITCEEGKLDELEKQYIIEFAKMGFQLRNKTVGGQGKGKNGLDNQKPSKGYHDGLKQGYLNARKEIANLFAKHLNYSKKSDKPNKNQEKALAKFEAFLKWEVE
jgi:hypothetical protein